MKVEVKQLGALVIGISENANAHWVNAIVLEKGFPVSTSGVLMRMTTPLRI